MRVFDKEGWLWLDWDRPNPINVAALFATLFAAGYSFAWAVYLAVKFLPWPQF